jgi:hypothetical protein
MTSKVSKNKLSIKSISQGTRNTSLSKLTSVAGQPLRKLVKTIPDCGSSVKSDSTAATEQEFRIRFSEDIDLRHTLSCRDYTTEEIQACWYTAEENQRIHRNCCKVIRKMMDEGSELKDKKKYCSRGLEQHTNVGAAIKMENRLLALNAVLEEQMNQWEEAIFDEDAIAKIYYRASSSCQMRANNVGLRDHRATEAFVKSRSTRRSRSVAKASAA